jgi:hypothetical protein
MDNRFQVLEADMMQIQLNVRNTLRQLMPEDQQDFVP